MVDALRGIASRFQPVAVLGLAIWAAHLINVLLLHALTPHLGLVPRSPEHLIGVATMPFVHGSWAHLIANTAPLLTLGALILALHPRRFWPATVFVAVLGGSLTWTFGASVTHVGASGLIFGWFGYLVAAAFIERSYAALIGAAAALVLYGAPTALGLLDRQDGVSWDAHAYGLAAGVAAAWALSRAPVRRRAR